jgi:hypothetical protein
MGLESHPDEAIQKHFSTTGFYSHIAQNY